MNPPSKSQTMTSGAALVVGGGIAGMQASLDLADQGFKVYLVEKSSAIGGKMAQLDKTFPTNDCAMCTISPKLVETGRHPNIELLTDSEVLQLEGEAGHFRAHIRQNPRYVDADKCVACGDCVDVCPAIVADDFNEGLSTRRAVFKQYPQAVPNALAITKAGIAPCRDACPAGQRAQGYIALIREGRWHDALRVIKMDNPFPGICGRICNHRCEDACNRALVDEPINIRALKRFVTDKVYAEPRTFVEPAVRRHEERVAIIGAGPCGLTAAQDLVLEGYGVTVFEAMPVAGGMLRLGVPEFRLPLEIIEREVQDIVDLGVDLRLNHRVEDLDDLFASGFDAVLIAVGAHEGIRLPIPGADLDGVLINTRFLRDVRLGHVNEARNGPSGQGLGGKVLVLGGGNVAVDCARSAIRLGAEVHMACLEDREKMPCHQWEVEAAEAEGVVVHNGRTFERILDNGSGGVAGVICQRVDSFHFDQAGRLHVSKIPGSEHLIPCDSVIFSVGQRAGLAFIPDDAGVGITDRQTIAINPNTLAATREGVFAAGDSVSGTAFVIEAVASGRQAAASIMRFLQGESLEPQPRPQLPVVHFDERQIEDQLASGAITRRARVPMPLIPTTERRTSFQEVERGYDDESARMEAERCLACGVCSECMSCVFACGVEAIDHDAVAQERVLDVGSVILAPGFEIYQSQKSEEFGFGRFPNVITSLQLERLLSASGPTFGSIRRPSDGRKPQRIAFLQCIGSRDQNHDYCSAVCCMAATKEAVIAKEHDPNLQIDIFFMDLRAFSKGYWQYFRRARDQYGIEFRRCRPSSVQESPTGHDLLLTFPGADGQPQSEVYDIVVLTVGMEISPDVRALSRRLRVEIDSNGFCRTRIANPVETSRPGVFAVGPYREPCDIPQSVVEASSAAASAAALMSAARHSQTRKIIYPPERDVRGQEPRIGVFVCHCGSNIAGFLDVDVVAGHAAQLPYVVLAETNLYTCSQDSIRRITTIIKEKQLNRVVVASCTPRTHEALFRDSLRQAGLNPYLFEMANIRNHCSWVHSHDRQSATLKAQDLVRMAIYRAAFLQAQKSVEVPVTQSALVVGGGVAGMGAALALAEQGFRVHLVEKERELGGNLRHVFTKRDAYDPQGQLRRLVQRVNQQELVSVYYDSQLIKSSGFMGNFKSIVEDKLGKRTEIAHGATILATGGKEYRGTEFEYGKDPRILTQLELEARLERRPEDVRRAESVAMILCVGPAQRYCSQICCDVALKNAIFLRKVAPHTQVVVFYRDIRSHGFGERLYTKARELGVLFVRYEEAHPPRVEAGSPREPIRIVAPDLILQRALVLSADLVILSMPVVPSEDAKEMAALLKVPLGSEGFFQEAHPKLRPVDFSTGGIFVAGAAHYPKLIDDTLIQAQAAAARAARILSRETLTAGGQVAVVDESLCTGCLTCVRICPFGVPVMRPDRQGVGELMGAAYIEAAVCQGCGICASECPAQAIQLMHYTPEQMRAKIHALKQQPPDFVPLNEIGSVAA